MAYKDLGPNQRTWVRALRSGKYDQVTGTLQCVGDRFCCLGVACKVAEKKGVTIVKNFETGFLRGDTLQDQFHTQVFLRLRSIEGEAHGSPSRIAEYLAYVSKVSGFDYVNPGACLVDLNDDYGLDFKQIAGVLVRFPDLFFTGAK